MAHLFKTYSTIWEQTIGSITLNSELMFHMTLKTALAPLRRKGKGLGMRVISMLHHLMSSYQTIGMHRRMMTPMIPHLHITARSEQLLPTFSTSKSYHKCRFRTYCRTFVCKDQYRGMLRGIIAGQIDSFFPLPYRRVYNEVYYILCSGGKQIETHRE